jgi:hypothetical protein
MSDQTERQAQIETWAIVEIMGHQQLAGFCRTEAFGGTVMLRVDRPDLPEEHKEFWDGIRVMPAEAGFTQYVGMGSIYRLTPCSEASARLAASRQRLAHPKLLALPGTTDDSESFDHNFSQEDTDVRPTEPRSGD